MKKIILLLCAFIVSCNQEPTEIKNPIKGVWELEGFIRYENNVPKDTVSWSYFKTTGFQFKIFTDNYMMFVGNRVDKDSISGEDQFFGQAGYANKYEYSDGFLTEFNVDGTNNFQGWKKDAPKKDDMGRWIAKHKIDIGPNHYSQKRISDDSGESLAEYYLRVE
tara:strand:- start:736 stop:1227 length:492 start_codon:yes stop_codon:yes gene_type:complete